MGIQIESGTGNGLSAGVGSGNRLNTSSRNNPRIYYISRDEGDAYSWFFEDHTSAAGDFIAYIKNTSTTKDLIIDEVEVSSNNAATFKMHEVSGTASGTTVTSTNLNLASGNTSSDTSVGDGDVSGLSSVAILEGVKSPANTTVNMITNDAIRVPQNSAVAVEYDQGTTGGTDVTIIGYYE